MLVVKDKIIGEKSLAVVLFGTISLLLAVVSCSKQTPNEVFRNPDLPIKERVDDLVNRMTLDEKISQMVDLAPAIDRLGVPEYAWWNEALHGVARAGLATVYPQAIGIAATWDEDLVQEMATAISDEARAKYHENVRNGQRYKYQGLTIWSPNINLFRDPRWGRGQETYGEDPYLTGRLAVPFIHGLQGDNPDYLKTIATVKHFAVHSGPEPERHVFDAIVSERDFHETYLPMFQTGIQEGGAYSLMCAYNRLDGEPACSSAYLLENILRNEWGFDGFVVSDCWALVDIHKFHKVVQTPEEAAARALKAGTDLECGQEVYSKLMKAVEMGLVTEADIDVAVKRLFTARFKLGMFDPDDRVEYASIPYEVVDNNKHKELAQRVSRESIVLLKNDGVLPLSKDLKTVAVIGPNSDQWTVQLGNYNGMPSDLVTPLQGIREAVSSNTEVLYSKGSEIAEGFSMFERVPADVLFSNDGVPSELSVEYFNSHDMQSQAVYAETTKSLDVKWFEGAPRDDMDVNNFAVRWRGMLKPKRSGEYRLGAVSTMKFKFYLDGEELFRSKHYFRDEHEGPQIEASESIVLAAGKTYQIKIEAYESYGDAQMQFVWSVPEKDLHQEALTIAKQADAVILFLGLTPRIEGEEMDVHIDGFRGGDRTKLELPKPQQELMKKIVEAGKPTVLVLLNGGALAVNWADKNVPAILEAWYPGQAGGTAIAEILFGDYNPSGRLPVTFYKSLDDLPPFEDYAMKDRSYKYFKGEPLYAFGHGLSYTSFGYKNLSVDSGIISENSVITVRADITNLGARAGQEVVQMYVSYPDSSLERPIKELRGFKRVSLQPNETKTIDMVLKADDVRYWDAVEDRWSLENKPVLIQLGASSSDIRLTKSIKVEVDVE